METKTAVLNVMTDLRQQLNTPEQNVIEYLSQEKFNQSDDDIAAGHLFFCWLWAKNHRKQAILTI